MAIANAVDRLKNEIRNLVKDEEIFNNIIGAQEANIKRAALQKVKPLIIKYLIDNYYAAGLKTRSGSLLAAIKGSMIYLSADGKIQVKIAQEMRRRVLSLHDEGYVFYRLTRQQYREVLMAFEREVNNVVQGE